MAINYVEFFTHIVFWDYWMQCKMQFFNSLEINDKSSWHVKVYHGEERRRECYKRMLRMLIMLRIRHRVSASLKKFYDSNHESAKGIAGYASFCADLYEKELRPEHIHTQLLGDNKCEIRENLF